MNISSRPGRPGTIAGRARWSTLPDDMGLDWETSRGREPHEVMIPPGKCVYYWLGCERKRFRRNRCVKHYREELPLGDYGEPPPAPQPICVTCRQRQSTVKTDKCQSCLDKDRSAAYYAANAERVKARQQRWRQEHAEEEHKRKQLWRENNREHIRAYDSEWGKAKTRARREQRASTQEAA